MERLVPFGSRCGNVCDVEMGPANQTLSVKDVRDRAHEDEPDEIRLAMAAGLFRRCS